MSVVVYGFIALLAELVDAPDLGSGAERRESSSLLGGTKYLHDTRSIIG